MKTFDDGLVPKLGYVYLSYAPAKGFYFLWRLVYKAIDADGVHMFLGVKVDFNKSRDIVPGQTPMWFNRAGKAIHLGALEDLYEGMKLIGRDSRGLLDCYGLEGSNSTI